MVIRILRQNRWIALLIGVLLVSLSLISMFGMQTTTATTGEEQREMPSFKAAAPDPVHALNKTEEAARSTNDGESIELLTSIVFQPWNVPEGEIVSLLNLKEDDSAEAENLPSHNKTKAAALESKETDAKQAVGGETENKQGNQAVKAQAESHNPPTTLFFTRTQTLTQAEKDQATWTYEVSAEERLLLEKIVMAEAEGEPYEGKVAVANVVLNRLRSANFPNTITDVIYQKHQFSPVANGRLKRVTPNEETIRSVEAALRGHKEVADDTYFFLSLKLAQDLTVHHSRTFVKQIGNHSFYK